MVSKNSYEIHRHVENRDETPIPNSPTILNEQIDIYEIVPIPPPLPVFSVEGIEGFSELCKTLMNIGFCICMTGDKFNTDYSIFQLTF